MRLLQAIVDAALRWGHEHPHDFWDLAVLPGGEVGVALGDVAGHDMIAAAQMAQVRSVIRALRRQAPGSTELIELLRGVWEELGSSAW